MSYVLLGDGDSAMAVTQDMMPYLGSPVYLRKVTTPARADAYAAAGFHVSTTRALAGGCADPASAISGTDPKAVCKTPMGRADVGALWQAAANGYYAAYAPNNVSSPIADRVA